MSESAREDLVQAARVPRERIHVTPNGVDDRFFDAKPPEGPRTPYLLAVGTLEPRKNLPTAAAIRSALDDRERPATLVAAARQRARRFTWQACAEATLAVYRQIADCRGSAPSVGPIDTGHPPPEDETRKT